MEDPSIFGDEVVADSEGEDDSFVPLRRARITGNDSTVSQFTENRPVNDSVTNFTPVIATKASTIENASSSSAGPSAPSRPRPKPAYKGTAGFQGDSSISNGSRSTPPSRSEVNSMLLDFAIPSIADRAKMRRRDNKSAPGPTFSEFTPPPLPPSKPNSTKTSPIEVLELTDSDDDELALAPASRKKKSTTANSKAKPRKSPVKRARVVHSPPPDSSQPSLPIATSPVLPPVPLPGSTLPPSDPPLYTPLEHPPIAVLPKLTVDQGSSSRVTSPCPSGKRKRSSERDELEGDDMSMDVDKQPMPPPQTTDTGPSKKVKKTREKKKQSVSVEIDSKKAKGKKATKEKVSLDKGKGKAKEVEVAQTTEIIDDDDDLFGDGCPETSPTGAHPSTSSSFDRRQAPSETSARPNPVEDGEEREPPQKRQKTDTNANTKKDSSKKKRSQKVVMSDEEDDGKPEEAEKVKSTKKNGSSKKTKTKASKDSHDQDGQVDPHPAETAVDTLPKENVDPSPVAPAMIPQTTATETPSKPANPSISSRYTIAPRTKSTPMSELIRRANAQPGSPFYSPTTSSAKPSAAGTAYSPYMKSSRSMLSRIAPLHRNRRTPPPPPPPPPPRKKSKKELELEEKWEEELVESVGGLTEWTALPEQERKDMRRMKREKEMYGYED